ncbi:hypothetical protein HUT16_30355 [Kitasatospora sp. NA04385]|uniref:DUF7824 domain-containing protein n=1 Tax=Kitasatospora sp. NA04385 TaxID=2742135 RepID=UPI001591E4A8|nr:DUF6493 family protein [Kitasatospora sp. NA04385]QKW22823.1 hypothetical protein HUT16_30355 [Kitasatospora sp. NA04385]
MDLVTAIRNADPARAAELVAGMDGARRSAELPGLEALRRELIRRDSVRPGWDALLVVGAVCHSTPAGAADWLARGELDSHGAWDRPPLIGLLDGQPAAWQRETGLRLANRRAGRADDWGSGLLFGIAEHLLRRSDTPPPAEPGFVVDWMRDRSSALFRSAVTVLPPDVDLRTRLRADSFTPVLAPLVFEGPTARWFDHFARRDDAERWTPALVALVADGTIDRAPFLARGFARLVRGGAPGELRTYLDLVRALEPGVAELADNRRALLALLDGDSVVAGYALESLMVLEGAGLLGEGELAEAAGVVLARPEKKLVRAQLGWLDRVAAGGRVEVALRAVAGCFGHPDRQVQGQALKVVKRHVRSVEGELLAELRAAALLLDPAHASVAAELLGVEVVLDAWVVVEDRLPEPPRPVAMPVPLATPAEVAEELAAAMAAPDESTAFERVLDGLARHAWQDRTALAAALAPLRPTWEPLHVLARIAAGTAHPEDLPPLLQYRYQYGGVFGSVLAARLHETAHRLAADPVPFLLSTPTWCNGALDGRELVARLARYEELGVRPGPVDFAQALLRTAGDGSEGAEALTSPAGQRLAAWLRGGGLPRRESTVVPPGTASGTVQETAPGTAPGTVQETAPGKASGTVRHRHCEQPAPAADRLDLLAVADGAQVPEPIRLLLGPRREAEEHYWGRAWQIDGRATAILPRHREETAVRLVPRLGDDRLPLLLAENTGPCGPAVHLLLALSCGTESERGRAAAVDALLSFAAQRAVDPGALGRAAGALVRDGAVRPNRLARTLTELAAAGAPRLAWDVLAALLPVLLAAPVPRGAAELLATAVDRARETGARGGIDAVTRVATGGGRSRTVTEAGNLAAVLG